MNVVVGKSLDHRTPIFVEQMEYVIFRPYWNPPRGITVQEIVPHARRDPGYLGARGSWRSWPAAHDDARRCRRRRRTSRRWSRAGCSSAQKPGPANSLGLAKFIFPNNDDVYMHGTPAQQLFSRARRDFSHGCIRLEDPARFAEWVLRDQPEWTRERIDEAMQGERPTRVNLKEKLTVVIFYDTVHVNSERRGVLRRRHLRPRPRARRRARAGLSVPGERTGEADIVASPAGDHVMMPMKNSTSSKHQNEDDRRLEHLAAVHRRLIDGEAVDVVERLQLVLDRVLPGASPSRAAARPSSRAA